MNLHHYVPRDGWLIWLAQGWNLGSPYGLPVAALLPGHETFAVMLWRPDVGS